MQAGFDPAAFWPLTPREINNIMRAVRARARQDHNDRAWQAWTAAALTRAEKLPKLAKLLVTDTPRHNRRMDWQDMLSVIRAIHVIRERTTRK